jgi:hypothetical protein
MKCQFKMNTITNNLKLKLSIENVDLFNPSLLYEDPLSHEHGLIIEYLASRQKGIDM